MNVLVRLRECRTGHRSDPCGAQCSGLLEAEIETKDVSLRENPISVRPLRGQLPSVARWVRRDRSCHPVKLVIRVFGVARPF
jgi:hypothetical protein